MGDSMNSFRSQQQVKEELLSVLRDDPGNNDRIVALSNELAKLDVYKRQELCSVFC